MRGRVVFVAGASGGIGQAIGKELVSVGADVLLIGRSMARLRTAFPDFTNRQIELLEADLTDPSAVDRIACSVAQRGRLDALILCSGIYERSSDPEVFHRQMLSNVLGPYALLQAVRPVLRQARGQVVFVSSSQALHAAGEVGQYAATMHATKAIADSLRAEVNGHGVRVMTLYLGRTAGERQRSIFALEGRPYRPESLIQPADVARIIVFLLELPMSVEVTDLMMRPMKKS